MLSGDSDSQVKMTKQEYEKYMHEVQMRKQDRLFNQIEMQRKIIFNPNIIHGIHETKTANDVKLNVAYNRPPRPSSAPLPVTWTKMDLIFGKFD